MKWGKFLSKGISQQQVSMEQIIDLAANGKYGQRVNNVKHPQELGFLSFLFVCFIVISFSSFCFCLINEFIL